jgi:hypothetical protein
VGGFAGGGIYFLTAAYDEKAEILADLTHGTTFEKILKQGYKVTSVQLKLTKVSFASNEASGETCYQDACSLSPRNGFKAGGAGGAIYALESLKDFGLPVTVTLDGVAAIENLSTHNEDKQKADLVFRNLTKLIVKNDNLAKHPSNKFVMSLMSVHDADLTGSPKFPDRRKQGLVFEEKSNVNP